MSPFHDPAVYMKQRGYPVDVIIECAACPKQFAAKDGITFPATIKSGEIVMAAFCCMACFLNAYPREQMWRA
jgi:hypothetical protein